MELNIINFTKPENPILIKNFEELKADLQERAKYYNDLVFTDDKMKDAKSERANLNKFKDTIETRRKEIKKAWAEPYLALESQVKELNAIIDEPIGKIDAQIKDFEERKKTERKEELTAYFVENATAAKLNEIVNFEQIFNSKWLNASTTVKSAKEEISSILQQIDGDLKAIDMLDGKYKLNAKDHYLRNFNLSSAIAEHNRLVELEQRMAAAAPAPQPAQPIQPEPQPQTDEEDRVYDMTIRFVGRKSALKAVFDFAKQQGVKMQKIEKADQ
jgi:hypothetical protein